MKATIGLDIRNSFDVYATDVRTGKKERVGGCNNIVLTRIYNRLLNYQSYFDYIVYGRGDTTPNASNTTLNSRIGYKTAVQTELVRDYPTSKWTKKIQLGTGDENGETIREVGISHETTNVNTHALIKDAEGNPLEIEKTEFKIIDIYATVYVSVFGIDDYSNFISNGLVNYLTGGSAPSASFTLRGIRQEEYKNITATKYIDTLTNEIQYKGRYNIDTTVEDACLLEWIGGGLAWRFPYPGVYTGTNMVEVEIGIGDGTTKEFDFPNIEVTNLDVFLEGLVTSGYTIESRGLKDYLVFDTAPLDTKLITANYKTKYVPKNDKNVLDFDLKLRFGVSQPGAEVVTDFSDMPGPKTLVGGNMVLGFFGETDVTDLITGGDLCTALDLTAGTLQHTNEPWLKYALYGEVVYVTKKPIRYNISWDAINAVGAVFGDATVEIGGKLYAVRLLSTDEWNKLMYPVHKDHPSGAPAWAEYENGDIVVGSGNGRATWTSSPSGASRIFRGSIGVTYSDSYTPSISGSNYGFRPVLIYLGEV